MLGIVLICYRNIDEIISFLENQTIKIKEDKKIIVVNNSNQNDIHEQLKKKIDNLNASIFSNNHIELINANANLGYAKANNLGASFLIEKYGIQYLLFSNTDIQIKSSKDFTLLLNKIVSNDNIKIIGPKIIDQNGVDQNPYKYFSFFRQYILKLVLLTYHLIIYRQSKITSIIPMASEGYYYRLMGSFVLVEMETFVKIGMFDENTFLYAEESILAEKLSKLNLKCYYYPNSIIYHSISGTISEHYNNKNRFLLKFSSDLYYYKTYCNLGRFEEIVGRCMVFFHTNLQMKFINLIKFLTRR